MKRDSKDLAELVGTLETELITADRQLAQTEKPELQRKAMLRALKALKNFVRDALDGNGTYSIHLLRHHLDSVDLGHESEIFTPPLGRPSNPRDVTAFQAIVAAALELKMRELKMRGERPTENPAAKWVSRELAKAKVEVDPKRLMTWRDKFKRGTRGCEWFNGMLDQSAADPDGLDTLVRTASMMVPDVQEPPH